MLLDITCHCCENPALLLSLMVCSQIFSLDGAKDFCVRVFRGNRGVNPLLPLTSGRKLYVPQWCHLLLSRPWIRPSTIWKPKRWLFEDGVPPPCQCHAQLR